MISRIGHWNFISPLNPIVDTRKSTRQKVVPYKLRLSTEERFRISAEGLNIYAAGDAPMNTTIEIIRTRHFCIQTVGVGTRA